MQDQFTFTTQFDAPPSARHLRVDPHDHRQMVFSALNRMTMIGSSAMHQINEATAISLQIATVIYFAVFGTIIQQVKSLN